MWREGCCAFRKAGAGAGWGESCGGPVECFQVGYVLQAHSILRLHGHLARGEGGGGRGEAVGARPGSAMTQHDQVTASEARDSHMRCGRKHTHDSGAPKPPCIPSKIVLSTHKNAKQVPLSTTRGQSQPLLYHNSSQVALQSLPSIYQSIVVVGLALRSTHGTWHTARTTMDTKHS